MFLTWLYLSSYVLLFGAELNAEIERQTLCDTTEGPATPLGQRGAAVAESVATDGEDVLRSSAERGDAVTARGDLLFGSLASRAMPLVGLERSRRMPAILAIAGLSALRRGGRAPLGVALMAAGGLLAWLDRRPAVQDAGSRLLRSIENT